MKTILFHILLAGQIEEDLVPRGGRRLEQRKHIKSNRVQLSTKNYSAFDNQPTSNQLFILQPTFTYNQLSMLGYTKSNQFQFQFINLAEGK